MIATQVRPGRPKSFPKAPEVQLDDVLRASPPLMALAARSFALRRRIARNDHGAFVDDGQFARELETEVDVVKTGFACVGMKRVAQAMLVGDKHRKFALDRVRLPDRRRVDFDPAQYAMRLGVDCLLLDRLLDERRASSEPDARTEDIKAVNDWLFQRRPVAERLLGQGLLGNALPSSPEWPEPTAETFRRIDEVEKALDGAPGGERAPPKPRAPARALASLKASNGAGPGRSPVRQTPAVVAPPLPVGLRSRLSALRPSISDRSGRRKELSGAELVRLLGPGGDAKLARRILQAVAKSDDRVLIVLLQRAADAGLLEFSKSGARLVAFYSSRILIQMNANQSAFDLSQRHVASDEKVLGLNEGEEVRFSLMNAQSAMRSGHGGQAAARYAEVFQAHPDRADAVTGYVTCLAVQDPEAAATVALEAVRRNVDLSPSFLLYVGQLALSFGDRTAAVAAFTQSLEADEDSPEGFLGLANVALDEGDRGRWLDFVRRYGVMRGLDVTTFDEAALFAPFAFATASKSGPSDRGRVTVVMTTFNSARTVAHAVQSVLAQSHENLELHIVDDVSTDGTRDLLADIAREDPRIHVLLNERNAGTYVSKNRAIAASQGDFVTFHDSDDWMHPERIAGHLDAMREGVACSISKWLRMDAAGRVLVQRGGLYTHNNPASTFLPRAVFDKIGLFDSVRTGADAEFLSRVRMGLGRKAVRDIGECRALGFHHDESLTQSGVAAFDEQRYSAVRLGYTEAWVEWQLKQAELGEALEVDNGKDRAFPCPPAIDSFQEI